jgi:hypothetical protein
MYRFNWVSLVLLVTGCAASQTPVVRPLAGHPGNIFIHGEEVTVALPGGSGEIWEAIDYGGKTIAQGSSSNGHASLGKLGVGYYEVKRKGREDRVTVGVIAPLLAPTPIDSPIASDVAMSWFYDDEARKHGAASLCRLAGITWVRDRMSWPDIEKKPGEFALSNRSDAAARIQSEAGLRVLQVNHIAPRWQKDEPKRFPHDLRDAYRCYRPVAKRWKGQVPAIEPWNEADIPAFGGHTGSEIATMQKASYLGLKAGNPDVTACLNVFAVDKTAILDDYNDNEAWPYIDTYNFHHYCGVERYPEVYANHRRISAGRPMWVTECNVPVQWAGDAKKREPSDEMLRVQARRVARVLSAAIFQGAKEAFYFILGDYVEGQTQFGIVHQDLTPRPAYLALAATGRLLAGAKPVGQWKPNEHCQAFAFRALPDGLERDVLVVWSNDGGFSVQSDLHVERAYDLLGRPIPALTLGELRFGADPTFVILPKGSAARLALQPPPGDPEFRKGETSPIVLQSLLPGSRVVWEQSLYKISKNDEKISIYAYNFGDKSVHGTLAITAPDGWKATMPTSIDLAPGDRCELMLDVVPSGAELGSVKIIGDFGPAGHPVLSFRLLPDHD